MLIYASKVGLNRRPLCLQIQRYFLSVAGRDIICQISLDKHVTNLYLGLRYSRNGVLDFKVTVIVGSQE